MRRILLIVLLLLVVGVPAYAYLNGVSMLVVRNESNADANVTIFIGAQPVGSSRIERGGSDFYLFAPHTGGRFTVSCRKDNQSTASTTRIGRVQTSTPAIYRLRLETCARIREVRQ